MSRSPESGDRKPSLFARDESRSFPSLAPRGDDETSSRAQRSDLDPERASSLAGETSEKRWRPNRRGGFLLLLLVLALAALGHWAYWYRDRPHEMAPAKSRLLAEAGALPVRLWLPYPHQNLGALGNAVERPQEVLAAAARLAGLPEPAIPRLGAFGIPAARELLVEASRDGRTLRAAMRLYPSTAALTRLAGTVARNPWLAGGEVRVNGSPAVVSWEGLTWRLRSAQTANAANDSASAATEAATSASASAVGDARPGSWPVDERDDAEPTLALIDLAEPVAPLPAGRFPLRREDGDLVIRLGARLPDPPDAGPPQRVMLVWLQRRADRAEALLLLEADRQGLLASLPAAAAWAQPSGAVEALPGGHLLRQLAGVRAAPFGGGELAATESSAAARARDLAKVWLPLASGRSFPPLALGGWLAIAPAAEQAGHLHQLLDEIPLLGAAEAQRWGDVATVLRAARAYRTLSCWLAADGSRGELRLHR